MSRSIPCLLVGDEEVHAIEAAYGMIMKDTRMPGVFAVLIGLRKPGGGDGEVGQLSSVAAGGAWWRGISCWVQG